MRTYKVKLFQAFVFIHFEEKISQMEIAVVEYVEAAARFVCFVTSTTDLADVVQQILNFWNKLLKAFPSLEDFHEDFQSILKETFDDCRLLIDCVFEAGEVELVLKSQSIIEQNEFD